MTNKSKIFNNKIKIKYMNNFINKPMRITINNMKIDKILE